LQAVGNGDPTCMESYFIKETKAFYGKCMAIVKSNGQIGIVKIHAESEGLVSCEIEVKAK
jgi:beta-galactosidase